MPVVAAVKIAAAPGNRTGGVLTTPSMNSSSFWRSLERSCSSNCQPLRQVSIRKAMRLANSSGKKPASMNLVMFAGTKNKLNGKEEAVHQNDHERVVAPFQGDESRKHRRDRHQHGNRDPVSAAE